ncbi:PTS sugar transporter subunit IIA [Anaerorhabdus sp.]|uniref:PTS sugar transporter subunit IIA n=1 Tax=Anaerorhabdus sp. TaxID=1872524 RepID=UPI002FC9BCD9
MDLFGKLKKKEETKIYGDNEVTAIANAKMIPASAINDPAFSKEMLGQTIGFELKDGLIVSPANGTLEVMFPTGHAFGVRMHDDTALLVHIGIDTVEMDGEGFQVFAKQGDKVRAGQKLVKVDLDKIKKAGFDSTTMLIVTEVSNSNGKIDFIDFGDVECGEIINKSL